MASATRIVAERPRPDHEQHTSTRVTVRHAARWLAMDRQRTAELMDDPDVDPAEHEAALRALNRSNRLLGMDRALARLVREVAGSQAPSVLDLGAGGGGFLGYLQRPEDSAALRVGLDRSWFALRCAIGWHPGVFAGVVGDVRCLPFRDRCLDVVTCSLLLHHFDPPDAVTILREAARVSRRGIAIADLSRSRFAWVATWLATRLLSRSRLFRVDGPRSVRAAYTAEELRDLARQAGLPGATVRRRFPFRLVLTWRRPDAGGQP